MVYRTVLCVGLLVPTAASIAVAQGVVQTAGENTAVSTPSPMADVLSPGRWQQVERSVDRALVWLATQQGADGSFRTDSAGQPAVTSLAVMAFLSRGHLPGAGPHGERLNQAIDFVLSCQKPDGLFSYEEPAHGHQLYGASHAASYNHAIAGLMLGEVYGQVTGERARRVKDAIEKALQFTRQLQVIRDKARTFPQDAGGWRYVHYFPSIESDLSVTGWHLMFLRSARNAEFDVPQGWIDEAMAYVRRCWSDRDGMFHYGIRSGQPYGASRGTTGAGILSLSLGGQHQTPIALAAGDWLVAHPYRAFGEKVGPWDMFFYSAYYCSQAAAQLGGRYWQRFYPPLVDVLLGAQSPDGSWPPEPGSTAKFGQAYSTALATLSLTPPYQLLPVYQR